MRLKIGNIAFSVKRSKLKGGAHGYCSSPPLAPQIHLDSALKHKKLMEIALHETCHAAYPLMDEEEVVKLSRAQTRLLYALGFRQVEEPRF